MRSQKEKEQAKKLRLQGRSYGEISKSLGISKSTLHGWLYGLEISDEAKRRIQDRVYEKSVEALIRRNKRQTAVARDRARQNRQLGASKIKFLTRKDLLTTGAALYWAEGYKKTVVKNGRKVTHHVVSLTNSDPDLIKLFLKFLREYCGVPNSRIKVTVRVFQHHNTEELKKIWQEVTGVEPKNLTARYYAESISSKRKRPYNRLPYGVAQITVGSTNLFHQIMGYIEGLRKLV